MSTIVQEYPVVRLSEDHFGDDGPAFRVNQDFDGRVVLIYLNLDLPMIARAAAANDQVLLKIHAVYALACWFVSHSALSPSHNAWNDDWCYDLAAIFGREFDSMADVAGKIIANQPQAKVYPTFDRAGSGGAASAPPEGKGERQPTKNTRPRSQRRTLAPHTQRQTNPIPGPVDLDVAGAGRKRGADRDSGAFTTAGAVETVCAALRQIDERQGVTA